MLDAEFAGSLELLAGHPTSELRVRLLELPGVGPETADAILLYALGHPVPMADEYLRRIVERHRLLNPPPLRSTGGYNALIQLTTNAFAEDPPGERGPLFNEFHALTVAVGKAHCGRIARCISCPLSFDLAQNGVEPPNPAARR
jgi:endonuclease-3 related protein